MWVTHPTACQAPFSLRGGSSHQGPGEDRPAASPPRVVAGDPKTPPQAVATCTHAHANDSPSLYIYIFIVIIIIFFWANRLLEVSIIPSLNYRGSPGLFFGESGGAGRECGRAAGGSQPRSLRRVGSTGSPALQPPAVKNPA